MPWWIHASRSPSVPRGHRGRITPASSTYGPRDEGSTTAYPVTFKPGSTPTTRPGTGTTSRLIRVNRDHRHPGHLSVMRGIL